MNTIGKTLVILNLIFALVVAGFFVIDFGTRTNWRTAYESLKAEMLVAGTNTNVSGKTQQDLNGQVKRAKVDKETLEQKLIDVENVARASLGNEKLKTDEAIERATAADLNAQKAIAEKARLTEQNKDLMATLQNRDNMILALQNEGKKLRTEAIAKGNIADTTQMRNEYLLGRIQELERKIALRDAGVGNENNLNKDPNAPNPPSTYVKGKIDRVDAQDRSLVKISIGTDQGIRQDHTLEVFRMNPKAEYLGMIRIVEAKEHTAVGKLMRTSVSGTRALQAGDIVASSINIPSR